MDGGVHARKNWRRAAGRQAAGRLIWPSGVGLAGNFRQLVTVLGVLAGAGIFNGVTKYVAQYHDDPARLRNVVGTSSAMVLGFSTLLAIVFLLAAAPISQGLFGHTHYQGLVRLVALVQMGIAWANLLLALMKGFRDAAGNALALILGSIIGVIAYYVCYRLGGYEGALLGLALVPALVVVPAAFMLMRRGVIPLSYLKPQWDKVLASQLGKFTLMALITSVTLPVAYVMMRNLLAAHYSWDEVGIWQGVSSISDAYLQFITASFSVYLLPTLSRLTVKKDITREIIRSCGLCFLPWQRPVLPFGYCATSPSGCSSRRSLPPCAICLPGSWWAMC